MLKAWAYGDDRGLIEYPEMVGNVGGARKLHVYAYPARDRHLALCGVVLDGPVEYVGEPPARRPVCAACRKKADERT